MPRSVVLDVLTKYVACATNRHTFKSCFADRPVCYMKGGVGKYNCWILNNAMWKCKTCNPTHIMGYRCLCSMGYSTSTMCRSSNCHFAPATLRLPSAPASPSVEESHHCLTLCRGVHITASLATLGPEDFQKRLATECDQTCNEHGSLESAAKFEAKWHLLVPLPDLLWNYSSV
jgi:hypothetical protein